MENTIAVRIFDFLKGYPPFSLLPQETLLRVCEHVVVQYRQPGAVIFQQGENPQQFIYVVKEGAVHLIREEQEEEALIEQCDEGDVFGIRPLLAEEPYALTARVAEESLIYAVRTDGFEKVLEDNPKLAFYLARNFASGLRANASELYRGKLFLNKDRLIDSDFKLVEIQSMETSKKPVTCTASATIQEAAKIMDEKSVGSVIVVDEDQRPVGIFTDKDLRRKVATGKLPITALVPEIMSAPVITMPPSVTVADVQIEMVKHNIHHLCLTEDGTPDSKVIGVISEHDLLVVQGNNPAILIRGIKRCHTVAKLRDIRERAEALLRKYIYQEVAISFISEVMTEINDALIQRTIELSIAEMEAEEQVRPAADFCWLALGSEGRGEQLLRTDQDNALVFDDVDADDYEKTKAYYLRLAGKITDKLHACGFEYCPGEMMGSNPKWCLSLSEWKKQFDHWIYEPDPKAILFSSIFFDYRAVYGKTALARALTDHIFNSISEQAIFLNFMASNALRNPPPLTFFRNFVVERGGEHKNEFDIKGRAMMPLADAARVLILANKVGQVNNTFRRFEKMAELEPQNKELYEQAADAYEILMRYRALQGLKNNDSGRYFNPSELSKMERINLRNSFQPISSLQSLLNLRFQLAYLR
jgi:CBS domain-containing protein